MSHSSALPGEARAHVRLSKASLLALALLMLRGIRSLTKFIINVDILRLEGSICILFPVCLRTELHAAMARHPGPCCGEETDIQEPASEADKKQDQPSQASARAAPGNGLQAATFLPSEPQMLIKYFQE